ncbi:MAG: permease-like cell division protein FtsX [Bacteroidales bacterium]|nr:permease-like cell division protein FtsX [Bacteroidales bacterium]
MSKYPDSIDKITKARLRLSVFGSIFSIAVTMFLIGLITLIAFFMMTYINNISEKLEVEVLFYSDVREADIVAIEQKLKLKQYTATSLVSSRYENTAEAKKIIGDNYTDIITNPINASIRFTVKPQYANTDSLTQITKQIKRDYVIVSDVDYPTAIVDTFFHNTTYRLIVFGVCALFMLISMFLIANSIRLNIYAKRFNIKSMLLVGATRSFVRRPFVFRGFVQGVWGGFIAVALLATILYQGNLAYPDLIDFSYIYVISIILGSIFIFSILFTTLISFFSVNKYIKLKSDRLYL